MHQKLWISIHSTLKYNSSNTASVFETQHTSSSAVVIRRNWRMDQLLEWDVARLHVLHSALSRCSLSAPTASTLSSAVNSKHITTHVHHNHIPHLLFRSPTTATSSVPTRNENTEKQRRGAVYTSLYTHTNTHSQHLKESWHLWESGCRWETISSR